ncbi:MAG: NnrU protein [Gammaproteobacteria bacterium]|nr:NnrU protein [Gammaproteobacteria bacterium]
MFLLILGIVIWSAAHFLPATDAYKRKKIMAKVGVIPYKIGFALTIIGSMVLMVVGWRSITPVYLYALPEWVKYITYLFVLITFILFAAARSKTNIKRILRHPQLTGLVFWAFGHLLVNGDSRSLILFAGMLVWAKIQIILTNKRDGKRELPASVPVQNDVLTVILGTVAFVGFAFAHRYITGVALF